ncbi:Rne/Rng family ribonuclease [Neisseriaceae bacterium PsAf]|nr:Rne/Rng family ribonuclease [Neisseriaceae bacterium PsAf]MCV2503385.1 Rne/Rng family ribonuclease [Neisseriaceae bacterium]
MLQQGIPLPKGLEAPPETVLVSVMPHETKVAFYENNELFEFHIERNFSINTVGNIYLGKVKRVLPGMQSAFIDIGLERAAFLHFVDLVENRINLENPQRIEHTIFEGQSILVQVIKEPIGNKGARVTTQISLVGRHLVYLPQDNHIGVSQRIETEEQKETLKQKLESIIPKNHQGGYIIRTRASEATAQELEADLIFLDRFWKEIKKQSILRGPPSLIFKDLNIALRLLRDFVGKNTQKILVDSLPTFQEMHQFAENYCVTELNKIFYFENDEDVDLFSLYHVDDKVKKALYPRVNLKGGGYLIIESTESMTTIDVNTGGFVGSDNFQETIYQTNLEACQVVARELRLRNIGGIIIIDFIDMEDEAHQERVLQELAYYLSFDKTKVTLNGFTALGLVELTRKRTRSSLKNALTEKCIYCDGYGYIKSIQTICYEIMHLIYNEVSKFGYQSIKIIASSDVIECLLDEESRPLLKLCETLQTKITLVVGNGFDREDYELFAG